MENHIKNCTLAQIDAICRECAPLLQGRRLTKIYHKENKRFLFVFENGKALFVRLDMPYTRIHLQEAPLPYQLHELRKEWEAVIGAEVISLEPYANDRIVKLTMKKGAIFELFVTLIPYKAALTLVCEGKTLLGKALEFVAQEKSFEKIEGPLSLLLSEQYQRLEEEEEKKKLLLLVVKQKDKLQKTKQALFEELQKSACLIEEKKREVDLLLANFHKLDPSMQTVVLDDWEEKSITLFLQQGIPLNKQIEKRYKEIKKLKKRQELLPYFIQENEKALLDITQKLNAIERGDNLGALSALFPRTQQKNQGKKEPFRRFTSASGCLILVGRSAKENDTLSFKIANGLDLWFHADGVPGAHVVLKQGPKTDQDAIEDALQLAKYYSKAKEASICDVVMTEVKYLHKRKGAPLGEVVLKQRKITQVLHDEKRLKRLFSKPLLP